MIVWMKIRGKINQAVLTVAMAVSYNLFQGDLISYRIAEQGRHNVSMYPRCNPNARLANPDKVAVGLCGMPVGKTRCNRDTRLANPDKVAVGLCGMLVGKNPAATAMCAWATPDKVMVGLCGMPVGCDECNAGKAALNLRLNSCRHSRIFDQTTSPLMIDTHCHIYTDAF